MHSIDQNQRGVNLFVIGMRLSFPNAIGVIFTPGGAWRLLYSLESIMFKTFFTIFARPISLTISPNPLFFST
jgi:hypothetical protein